MNSQVVDLTNPYNNEFNEVSHSLTVHFNFVICKLILSHIWLDMKQEWNVLNGILIIFKKHYIKVKALVNIWENVEQKSGKVRK